MEGEINAAILNLKSLLKEKYGEEFRKFYLVNHDDDWSGLIKSKENTNHKPGGYYKIEDDNVVLED